MDKDQMQAAADRLSVKLDGLDLDSEERAVLGAMLGADASSVEPASDEVEGFALNSYLGLPGTKQGQAPSFMPAEAISLSFGHIQFTYTAQGADGSASEKPK